MVKNEGSNALRGVGTQLDDCEVICVFCKNLMRGSDAFKGVRGRENLDIVVASEFAECRPYRADGIVLEPVLELIDQEDARLLGHQ
jgi:hypothetical protein